MKSTLIPLLLCGALLGMSVPPVTAATITSKTEKTTLAGTEEVPLNDSGADKKAAVATFWKAQVLTGGLTASGSTSWDFSGSTATFKTSTGANTLNGAVTVNDATTPSITLASGKTNTGFLLINGKTSGSFKILPADSTAQAIVMAIAAQTSSGATITLPDLAGTGSSFMISTLTTNGINAANAVWGASNSLVWEGATANSFEGTDTTADVTADRTWTRPDATGTYRVSQASTTTALTSDNQAVTPGVNNVLQLTSDNATATNRTFTLSATGAIAGETYVLIGPATNACELADTGIQKLSTTWTPGPTDTLTLLFDGTNFVELARSDN